RSCEPGSPTPALPSPADPRCGAFPAWLCFRLSRCHGGRWRESSEGPVARARVPCHASLMSPVLARNDVRQYEALADEWWRPGGAFVMLAWIAKARAALLPPAAEPGAVLVDLGCGGG